MWLPCSNVSNPFLGGATGSVVEEEITSTSPETPVVTLNLGISGVESYPFEAAVFSAVSAIYLKGEHTN